MQGGHESKIMYIVPDTNYKSLQDAVVSKVTDELFALLLCFEVETMS